jgi:hypothetical protein
LLAANVKVLDPPQPKAISYDIVITPCEVGHLLRWREINLFVGLKACQIIGNPKVKKKNKY